MAALVALVLGLASSQSSLLLLGFSMILSLAALGWRTVANRQPSAHRSQPQVEQLDSPTPVAPVRVENREPARVDTDLADRHRWDWLNDLPPIELAEHPTATRAPTPYAKTGAAEMEEAISSLIRDCLRSELDQLRAEIRQSQELVVSTVHQRIQDLAAAESEFRRQFAATMEEARDWIGQSRHDTGQKLERLVELNGDLRSGLSHATEQAKQARATASREIAELADAVGNRAEPVAMADLEAVASQLQATLSRQMAGLRSQLEASVSQLAGMVTEAQAGLDLRLEAMAKRLPAEGAAAPHVAATNSALFPIRNDIRMLRNEVAAVREVVAEVRASVEREAGRAKPRASPLARKPR